MKEKIKELEKILNTVSIEYLAFQQRENVKKIEKSMPQIQEFVLWFFQGNEFGIENDLYQDMCTNLLTILKDMEDALRYDDCVLMHDAVAYGLVEYLELFVSSEEEEKTIDDNV